MTVKRPKGHDPKIGVPDVKFVDEMVRLSLAINPNLKHGQSTSKYLDQIRSQAIGAADDSDAQEAAIAAPVKSDDEKRAQAIRLFLDLRGADFERDLEKLRERQRALEVEERSLKVQVVEQIVDYLTIVHAGGASPNIAKECLREFKTLLLHLGVSDNDILRLVVRK